MNYEEKYKEILEWARKNKARLNGVPIEEVLPELAESEDERIRKMCITAVNIAASADGGLLHHEAKQCLDWLEKQKEQEPITDSVKFEEGFKTGRESGLRDGQKYVLNNLDSYGLCKPAEWSEEDERIAN